MSFLIAARRAEIDELEQLARTSELVAAVGRLVHALQRERGLSNVLLASQGQRFAAQRVAQVADGLRREHEVRAAFDVVHTLGRRNGLRLFSRIAWVMPGLDGLPVLRRRIGALELDAAAATAAYSKLIGGLLAVVFEAADGSTDPDIARVLAAMFNFMQGKEFAGQERACGAAAFTAGRIDVPAQQRWLQLIGAQERCFQSFVDFGGSALAELWRQSQPVAELAELERLRRIGCASPAGSALDRDLGFAWFDGCSIRIDAMQAIEERLTADMRDLCGRRTASARAEAEANDALLQRLPPGAGSAAAAAFFDESASATLHATASLAGGATAAGGANAAAGTSITAASASVAEPPALGTLPGPYGYQLERSIFDLLQEQARRLQATSDELDAVRAQLNERKLVERAKGLLMAHRRLTEQEAHKLLRQMAMNQNRRIVDMAESVLSTAELLPPRT